jgi:chromosome segregation ATPase
MGCLRYTFCSAVLALCLLVPFDPAFAEGQSLNEAQKSFVQQVQESMDQLKKANEVRDRAVQAITEATKNAKEAPAQISAMIDAVKELNSTFDEGSKFKTSLDAVANLLDVQIADFLADPDPTVQKAAESSRAQREKISQLQKETEDLVERGKTLVRKLEDRRRVAEKLVTADNVEAVISVAREALDQYKEALSAFEGVAERSKGSPAAPPSS